MRDVSQACHRAFTVTEPTLMVFSVRIARRPSQVGVSRQQVKQQGRASSPEPYNEYWPIDRGQGSWPEPFYGAEGGHFPVGEGSLVPTSKD